MRGTKASLHLNYSKNTSEVAYESIELWFNRQGRCACPNLTGLLVFLDGSNCNGSCHFIFNEELQGPTIRLGVKLRVCHFPTYCSKYYPNEHRVFRHVTRSCKGMLWDSIEITKCYLDKTETSKRLSVCVRIMDQIEDRSN